MYRYTVPRAISFLMVLYALPRCFAIRYIDRLEASQNQKANLIPQTEELLASYDHMTNTERNELLKVILEKIDYYKGADGEIVIDLYPRLPKI